MEIEVGDLVRSVTTGQEGRVSLINLMSAYVMIDHSDNGGHLKSFLLSELTKIEGPPKPEK